ncbi:unnamed protein product [Rotaria sordida]|uniref:NHL repeat-containing protein n=1 Tax=Rotaria sordida TaxID=392033 RepID=A0A815NYS1_9BILA|nr:unnamed protein product [Rotaria sordida]
MTTSKRLFFFVFALYLLAHASSSNRFNKDSSRAILDARTTWKPNGNTVAGTNIPGSALNQLNSSYGVFVDSNNALFVTDFFNNRVVKWELGATSGILYAEGQCGSGNQNQLCNPTAITINREGTLFVTVENASSGSVISFKKGATSGETFITGNTSFYGIVWDEKEEYLYLGHHREHRVVKYTKDGRLVGVVAGGNERGAALNQLDYPRGVAVDEDGSVYVADSNNHRIVKWMVNAAEGTIVAGGNGNGSRTDQISLPGGIIRDKNGTIYVADEHNHRIVSVPVGARNVTIIAGGRGQGNSSNQLSNPINIAFNNEGDLYVSDWNNFRVQMFVRETGPSSGSDGSYIYTLSSKWTQIVCFLSLMISTARFFT